MANHDPRALRKIHQEMHVLWHTLKDAADSGGRKFPDTPAYYAYWRLDDAIELYVGAQTWEKIKNDSDPTSYPKELDRK